MISTAAGFVTKYYSIICISHKVSYMITRSFFQVLHIIVCLKALLYIHMFVFILYYCNSYYNFN